MTQMYMIPKDKTNKLENFKGQQPAADTYEEGAFLFDLNTWNTSDSYLMLDQHPGNVTMDVGPGVSATGHSRGIVLSEVIFVLDTYVTPLICVIGFLGNILNLAVLSRSRFRQTDGHAESGAHIGLIYMALSDMILCVVMFPRALIPSMHILFTEYNFLLIYQAYSTGVITLLILTSTWITVDMTLLRYFYICHPFRSRKWNSRRCALIVYPVSCLICAVINIPSFFEYYIDDFGVNEKGQTEYIIDIGPLALNPSVKTSFEWIRIILAVFIPATILIFCNCCLIKALGRSHRIRLQSFVKDTNAQRSRKWITVTLIFISVGFIVLVFPCELMTFFQGYIRSSTTRTEPFILARSMVNTMQVANFALNFVLYCIINVHFRMALGDMCRCFPKSGNSSQPSSGISAGSVYSTKRQRMSRQRTTPVPSETFPADNNAQCSDQMIFSQEEDAAGTDQREETMELQPVEVENNQTPTVSSSVSNNQYLISGIL